MDSNTAYIVANIWLVGSFSLHFPPWWIRASCIAIAGAWFIGASWLRRRERKA